jgi:[ribosomal protein S5]-alanine N-acetyltransferase
MSCATKETLVSIIAETERLIVRPWQLDDAEDAFAIYNDPEVTRYLAGSVYQESIEQTRAWLARLIAKEAGMEPLGFWPVVERATDRVIGHALLQYAKINGEDRVELGYGFARASWGQGYATELARALLRFGFDTLNLDEIYGVVIPENTASRHVLEKIGMRNLGMGEYNGFPSEVMVLSHDEQ